MFDYKAKETNINKLNAQALNKTLGMFKYTGLPESIPQVELEKQLQKHGYSFVFEHGGEIYALTGGLGGLPDVYGNPTEINITNPALELNKSFKLSEGVLIRNDPNITGLMPLLDRLNYYLVENEISLVLCGFNSRMQHLISASDSKTEQSASNMVKKLIDGELSVVGENALFEGVRLQGGGSRALTPNALIEVQQYWRSQLLNELGISSNFNMKRERLNSSEVSQTDGGLFPLIQNMLTERLAGVEKLNSLFNLKVDVDFSSVWKAKESEVLKDESVKNGTVESGSQMGNGESETGEGQTTGDNTGDDTKESEIKTLVEMLENDNTLTPDDVQTIKEMIKELKQ